MTLRSNESMGKDIVTHWDDRSLLGRLQLIMSNRDIFHRLKLITEKELVMADEMPESALEYVLEREDCPIFTSINIKQDIDAQNHRSKLEAALHAVFS